MKRQGYIYDKICDIENIKKAIFCSGRGKKNKGTVNKIKGCPDIFARKMQRLLKNDTLVLGEDRHLEILEGSHQKQRAITVPHYYPDQIVHWCLILQIQPIIERGMYKYSCGSIPSRGGNFAKKYIEKILRNDKKVKYILKLDISKFFPSIRTQKLKELFRCKIKCPRTLQLIDTILDHGGETGLPIGYFTSQWFSNFYLEEVDHYIKEQLKARYYIRYVDDMVIIDTSKRKLHQIRKELERFMLENGYGLTIKDNWQVFKIDSRPLDFLGYRFYRDKTQLRKHIFYRLNRNMRRIAKRGRPTPHQARSTLSLLGWLSHIGNGKNYYLTKIKPLVSKSILTKTISKEDKTNGAKKNLQQNQIS